MAEQKLCAGCGLEYDWAGVQERGYAYCCEACSHGEDCTCPGHRGAGARPGAHAGKAPAEPGGREAAGG